MIACSEYGLGIGLSAVIMTEGEGHYGCPKVNTNHSLIYYLSSRLNLDSWVNQAIMGLLGHYGITRPLWDY